jgi:putative transposase
MFRFRLYPSKTQTKILEEQFEICRQAYNWLLLHCRETYKETKKLPKEFDLNNLLFAFKMQRKQLKQIHSQALQNISKRIKDAYTGFYARRKLGLKAGLPRFKKYGTYKSITYPQSGFKIEGNKLKLSKIDNILIKQHREIQGQIKTLTIKKAASGKWFACFSCIVDEQHQEKPFKDVGIDVGLKSFAVLSDGTVIDNPRFYRKSEKRLARLQRQLSRKEKGRNNNKARLKVARMHERIQNQRRDFLHKASRKIADKYETVYVEDLKIMNMIRNHHLSKSISDAGWRKFIGMIAYKESQSGGRLIQVNPRNTTQTCSRCGEQVKKSLSSRIHECPYCGLVLDRDLNASRNILKIGKELAEFRPVEEKPIQRNRKPPYL